MSETKNIGVIYVVATPIGNLDDFSPRAQAILSQVDFIACEDTRHSKLLLKHFSIQTPLISFHDFNENQRVSQILDKIKLGQSCALISDAGTPLISDPGYHLVASAQAQAIQVSPIPGASAVISALSAAGLASDRFVFEGFFAAKSSARVKQLEAIKAELRTVIFYASKHRILDIMHDMHEILGADRICVIARELTKIFETIKKGTIFELMQWIKQDSHQQKGEFVILIAANKAATPDQVQAQIESLLPILLAELSVKQAVKLAQQITHLPRNQLYDWAVVYKNQQK